MVKHNLLAHTVKSKTMLKDVKLGLPFFPDQLNEAAPSLMH